MDLAAFWPPWPTSQMEKASASSPHRQGNSAGVSGILVASVSGKTAQAAEAAKEAQATLKGNKA